MVEKVYFLKELEPESEPAKKIPEARLRNTCYDRL